MRHRLPELLVDQVIHWGYAAFVWSADLCLLGLAVFIGISIWRGDK